MKIPNYDSQAIEKSVLTMWKNHDIYEKIKSRNKEGKKFYFLQGPPYTSGRLHIGHAWNNALKDLALRYKRMKGFDVWDRAGYDMHGLPTEHKVQSKLELKNKEEIEKYGLKKFAEECMAWSIEMAKIMDNDLQRFAVWMDYNDPYYPVKNEFMEGEWWLIKKAHEKKRLYKGLRSLSWCMDCGTAIAKHEQEYKTVTENSIFVKFKVKNKKNEYLLIWTTTPWTIPFNLGVMANPYVDYVKIKANNEFNNDVWIVAKELAKGISEDILEKEAEIIDEFKGSELEGLEYVHFFEDQIDYKKLKKESPKIHTVLMSKDYVDTTSGTGLVHCAPGCGPEDFEVGHRNRIKPFNSIDQYGVFPDDMGEFGRLKAKVDDKKFVEKMRDRNAIVFQKSVQHDYGHCDRCKNPVVFRVTEQWFFKIEDLIDKMRTLNKKVNWVPKESEEQFDTWITNLRDNSITKQRFWGTPVPVWVNEKDPDDYLVIGSIEELAKYAGEKNIPKNLHKPFIDEVVIKNDGKTYRRIPDILDVWIDSATVSWNCLYYPKRPDLFEKYWPIDFILEASEQVRLWFYMLLLGSILTIDDYCYKNVYLTGMLYGIDGVKMSKSLGNIISPYEIVDKYGADTMRTYLSSISAGSNISFSWNEVEIRFRNLIVLWNTHKFLIESSLLSNVNPKVLGSVEEEVYGTEEKFIVSRAHSTLKKITFHLERYELDKIPVLTEDLYLDLSRTYIQLVRDKLSGDSEERNVVLYCIYDVLLNIIKMYSLVCPFISEAIYQNLRESFGLKEQSIHMYAWPEYDESKIDVNLENSMKTAGEIITSALSAREKCQIGRRWPLKELVIESLDNSARKEIERAAEVLKQQINVKEIKVVDKFDIVKEEVEPDFGKIGPVFADKTKFVASILQKKKKEMEKNILKTGKYAFELNGEKHEVTKDMFKITKDIPEPYIGMGFSKGFVYANKERSAELDAEGYARELMRHIQDARKKNSLEKKDKINLFVCADNNSIHIIQKYSSEIMQKVGAVKMDLKSKAPSKDYSFSSEFAIKGIVFKVWFGKE